jgi:MFS family permease
MAADLTETTSHPSNTSWTAYGWLAVISGALFLALLPFSAYIASLPFLQAEWGLTNTWAGVVFSSYLVGFALASLIILPLTDRYPPQRVMVASLALLVMSNILFPLLARDVWSAMLLRALASVGHVGAYIPPTRLVSDRFPGARRAQRSASLSPRALPARPFPIPSWGYCSTRCPVGERPTW